jgi:hypothetical protein
MKHAVKTIPDPDESEARKGMIAPEPILLEEGSYVYRFASDTAQFGYHASPWWIGQKEFEDIMARAARAGVDLGQKARFDLAVLKSWGSKMNVVVEVRISDRVWAWTGLPKPQSETTLSGKIIRRFGRRGMQQLYLSGVVEIYRVPKAKGDEKRTGLLTPRGRQVLGVTGAKVLPYFSLS